MKMRLPTKRALIKSNNLIFSKINTVVCIVFEQFTDSMNKQ